MKRLTLDPLDLLAIVAVLLLTLGAGMIYLPAAPLVLGALLLAYAIFASRTEAPS